MLNWVLNSSLDGIITTKKRLLTIGLIEAEGTDLKRNHYLYALIFHLIEKKRVGLSRENLFHELILIQYHYSMNRIRIHAIILLFSLVFVVPFYFTAVNAADPITSVRTKEADALRILLYNVRNCRGMDDVIDYDRVAKVINTIAPDVVSLQELDSMTVRSNGEVVLKNLGLRTMMFYTYAAAIEFQSGKYGIGILSKERPLGFRSIPLPGREEPRVLLIVEFQNYFLAGCHLSLTPEDRVLSSEIISNELKDLSKPVFLTGDMNSIPSSETQVNLRKTFTTLNDTAVATIPVVNPNRCIDYIYTRKIDSSCVVLRRQVIDEQIASDHLPVYVDVKF